MNRPVYDSLATGALAADHDTAHQAQGRVLHLGKTILHSRRGSDAGECKGELQVLKVRPEKGLYLASGRSGEVVRTGESCRQVHQVCVVPGSEALIENLYCPYLYMSDMPHMSGMCLKCQYITEMSVYI